MKRRDFGLLTGAGIAATVPRLAAAQAAPADHTLLTTTLTPFGAERAGNADGSIPEWTGGLVSTSLPSDQPVDVKLFADEQPLYTVDAANMAQYQALLSTGTKWMMSNWGYNIKVFPGHRTAAAPQYVYDNTAANVARAQLDPRGGRFGLTGAYGGVPFSIINTSDPLVGGAQLIWNHLLCWGGYSSFSQFSPTLTVINGQVILVAGIYSRFIYPYYDPNGSIETYEGYYEKLHAYYKAPAASVGQEEIIWHSSNVNKHPDIVWSLLNGQGRVRKAPNEAFDTPSPATNGLSNADETNCFFGNPAQYDWNYIGKQEMLVPYNNNGIHYVTARKLFQAHFCNPELVRWEKHRVWIVEATLHPGERNVLARRRFYIDEDSWYIMLGESYDGNGNMVKCYQQFNRAVPSLPGTIEQGTVVANVQTGDYAYLGTIIWPPFSPSEYLLPQAPSFFDPQEMAANASF